MQTSWTVIVSLIIVAVLLSYVATCTHIQKAYETAFDAVRIGDTANSVVKAFGSPTVRENPEKLFSRYADTKCQTPCAERLWFENRLVPAGFEAWSVSLGRDDKVIGKYHWVSP